MFVLCIQFAFILLHFFENPVTLRPSANIASVARNHYKHT
jgi:hypothetical protein